MLDQPGAAPVHFATGEELVEMQGASDPVVVGLLAETDLSSAVLGLQGHAGQDERKKHAESLGRAAIRGITLRVQDESRKEHRQSQEPDHSRQSQARHGGFLQKMARVLSRSSTLSARTALKASGVVVAARFSAASVVSQCHISPRRYTSDA